jgi:hypothetical protein
MSSVSVVNLVILAAAMTSSVIMIDHMTKSTRLSVRLSAILLFAGILAEGLGYVWKWADWTDTLFFGGTAMFMIANIRGPSGACRIEYADGWAFVVGYLTLLGVVVAWVTAT